MTMIYQIEHGYLADQREIARGQPAPQGWTLTAPPVLEDDQAAQWRDARWVVVDATEAEAARHAARMDTLSAQRRADIESELNRRIGAGVSYSFPDGQTGTVQLRDARDQGNVQAVASAGNALVTLGDTTSKVAFRDQENVTHQLTGAEAVAFGLTVMNAIAAHYAAAWAHKDAIRQLADAGDLEGLEGYDTNTGWPPA